VLHKVRNCDVMMKRGISYRTLRNILDDAGIKRPKGNPQPGSRWVSTYATTFTDAIRTEIVDTFRRGAHVKDVMRDFKLSRKTVYGIHRKAVCDGILDPLGIDRRDAARRGWETRRARYDVSELARRSAMTRIARTTPEQRSESARKGVRNRLERKRMMEHATT
jgi:hypothetical protein